MRGLRSALPEPDPSPMVICPLHPQYRVRGIAPRSDIVSALCPYCRVERIEKEDEARKASAESQEIDLAKLGTSPAMDRALARYYADHPDSRPLSDLEKGNALFRMEEARRATLEAEREHDLDRRNPGRSARRRIQLARGGRLGRRKLWRFAQYEPSPVRSDYSA